MGTPPRSGHMFGYRFSHRSSHGGVPQLKKIDLTSARSQEQLTVKPSVLSLYSPTMGGLPLVTGLVTSPVMVGGVPQLKKIDLTSARSQEQLTVKPSVLSLYSPTMGDSPLVTGLVTGLVTSPVMVGESPQLKKIDLTSARSQEQLTVKPSVLSLYSPTMGGLSPDYRFGYRLCHKSSHGGGVPPVNEN